MLLEILRVWVTLGMILGMAGSVTMIAGLLVGRQDYMWAGVGAMGACLATYVSTLAAVYYLWP